MVLGRRDYTEDIEGWLQGQCFEVGSYQATNLIQAGTATVPDIAGMGQV